MSYRNVFVLSDASVRVRETQLALSPTDIYFALPRNAVFFMRYFPSRKAWRVFDARKVVRVPSPRQQRVEYPRFDVETETEDAAVMYALMSL